MTALNGFFMVWQEVSPLLSIKTPVQEAMKAVKEELSSAKSYNTTLMEMYNDLTQIGH